MGGGGEMRMLLTGGRVGSFEGAGVLVFDGLGSRWVLRARRLRPSRGPSWVTPPTSTFGVSDQALGLTVTVLPPPVVEPLAT